MLTAAVDAFESRPVSGTNNATARQRRGGVAI